ncbi:Peptidyl-tRNA hydrolase [hydrothermal vent metagenome]|uniref:peptidyl-tRNA hydrolase n=1 Tax=hydrothermal vent metagenome TaxID=652676 RepID=A0A1W1CNF6_9ZZZZ
MAIELIVGLGNPGDDYQKHRHNVGFLFIDKLSQNFKLEKKFFGETSFYKQTRLLKPTTFMNKSGLSVQAMVNFFKLKPEQILVVHDELDLESGVVKLKKSGGHGGHNGLRDIIKAIGSKDFYRLRIGIGHPGASHLVSDYVLHKPSKNELENIETAMDKSFNVLDKIIAGEFDIAMQNLHTGK